jgi:hypothetical protein
MTVSAQQALADRIASAPEGAVQFSFTGRAAVCGNGRGFIAIGSSTYVGSYSVQDGAVQQSCRPGPARVVLGRDGRTITSVETYVGGDSVLPGARDLGRVPARQAAEYLLGIAARSEGRPARDAILPAAIADSADTWQALLAIARDQNRPRESRTTALTWLGRSAAELAAAPPSQIAQALVSIARDESGPSTVRDQALSTLSRLPRGDGIPALTDMVRTSSDNWLGRQAMTTLSSSGDPRARQFLRQIAEQPGVAEEIRLSALRGLGRSYATGDDATFLRGLYARLNTPAAKESVLNSVADIGGRENVQWVLARAGDASEAVALRRKAIQAATRAEPPIADLLGLYDRANDRVLKEDLIGVYARRTERGALDKLLAIARDAAEDKTLRRAAISRLSKSDDPRVLAALRDIILP